MTTITFADIERELKRQLGLDAYDLLRKFKHFDRWCDTRGYPSIDPAGQSRNASTLWFAEYENAPDGRSKEPPSLNLWHWMLRHFDLAKDDAGWTVENGLRCTTKNLSSSDIEDGDWGKPIIELVERLFGTGLKIKLVVEC